MRLKMQPYLSIENTAQNSQKSSAHNATISSEVNLKALGVPLKRLTRKDIVCLDHAN